MLPLQRLFSDDVVVMGVYRCDSCRRLLIGYLQTEERNVRLVGPVPWAESVGDLLKWMPVGGAIREFPDVPAHIASAASEANACRHWQAYRAALMLARSVVEATAKDQGYENGTLYAKVEAMRDAGLIRRAVAEAATEIRELGNDMAHGDYIEPVNPATVDSALQLMSDVLNEVYQSPAITARLRTARESPST